MITRQRFSDKITCNSARCQCRDTVVRGIPDELAISLQDIPDARIHTSSRSSSLSHRNQRMHSTIRSTPSDETGSGFALMPSEWYTSHRLGLNSGQYAEYPNCNPDGTRRDITQASRYRFANCSTVLILFFILASIAKRGLGIGQGRPQGGLSKIPL